MNNELDIQLSGPLTAKDQSGNTREIKAIRIFDEGYGIIDIYVDFASSFNGDVLHDDKVLIGQILARLRSLGYVGPDFGHGDLGLQDDKLIVLEAPEEFNSFAASKGWKDLAEEFNEPDEDDSVGDEATNAQLSALMNKFKK